MLPRIISTQLQAASDTLRYDTCTNIYMRVDQMSRNSQLMYWALQEAKKHYDEAVWYLYPGDVEPPHLLPVEVSIEGKNEIMVYDARGKHWYSVLGAFERSERENKVVAWRPRTTDVYLPEEDI